LAPRAHDDIERRIPREHVKKLSELFDRADRPREYDGPGMDYPSYAISEEIGC
jgi:hypothetical protein